jgi:hypothetical protein
VEIEIKQEKFSDVYHEVMPLIHANFKETSWHNNLDLDLNTDLMDALEIGKCWFAFTARINKELVGYTTFFLNRHPHVNAKQAYQDVIYVKPEHRKSKAGIAPLLLTYAEGVLKNNGAKYFMCGAPVDYDNGYSKLLEKMGYKPIDILLGKQV